jgi:hypothetical protein
MNSIAYLEEMLWDIYQLSIFLCHSLGGAVEILELYENNILTSYNVDFADILPYIDKNLGKKSGRKYDIYGKASNIMWNKLQRETVFDKLPFKLGIGPQTRYELLENLMHKDKKIEYYLQNLFPKKALEEGNYIELLPYLRDLNQNKFINKLNYLINNIKIHENAIDIINRFFSLINNEVLFSFEQIIPKEAREKLERFIPKEDEIDKLMLFFKKNPKSSEKIPLYDTEHIEFHDLVDSFSITMVNDLFETLYKFGFYSFVLSHAPRIKTASRVIGLDYINAYQRKLVHHPGSALFLMDVNRIHDIEKFKVFLEEGFLKSKLLKIDLEKLESIQELTHLNKGKRLERFKQEKYVSISMEIHYQNVYLNDKYLCLIDEELESIEEKINSNRANKLSTKTIKIKTKEDINKIVSDSKKAKDKIRDLSKKMISYNKQYKTSISEWFKSKDNKYIKDLSDWEKKLSY